MKTCFACGAEAAIYRSGYMEGCLHLPNPASIFYVCNEHAQALGEMWSRQYDLEEQIRKATAEYERLRHANFLEEIKNVSGGKRQEGV